VIETKVVPPLAALGRRIMILGPSNSGKSTLSVAIAGALGIPAVHLDLLRHAPNTDWEQRTDEAFRSLHDAAIAGPEWVMEGNYSLLMPQRLARATGIIVLDDSLRERYRRYFWRTLVQRRHRVGGLKGGKDSVKWAMVHWLWRSRHSGRKYRMLAAESGLPNVLCRSRGDLKVLYKQWKLERPDHMS
jgi:adenylate kinase family enzyme